MRWPWSVASLVVSTIADTSATISAVATAADEGITERGIVISPTAANSDPTRGDHRTVPDKSAAAGPFSLAITGLNPGTEYSCAAYASDNKGTNYTQPISRFTTSVPVKLGRSKFFGVEMWSSISTIFCSLAIMGALIYVVGYYIWVNKHGAPMDFARGLITVLFATGTIGIAFMLTATAVMANDVAFDVRFGRGKEILTMLIGIFGTILGFYFGTAQNLSESRPVITADPVAIELKQGESKTVKLTFEQRGGKIEGNIHFDVTAQTGITAVFTPTTVKADSSATVQFEVSATDKAAVGETKLRIVGTPDAGGEIAPCYVTVKVLAK